MDWLIMPTARLLGAVKNAQRRKYSFLALAAAVFLGNVFLLAELDLLPETPAAPAASLIARTIDPVATSTPVAGSEAPVKVVVDAIGLTASVANPTTTDIESLDTYLLKGAVRYPTSALLGEAGNVVLFGHSSYLPIVGNQAYKTFDGIQKLAKGDRVTVYSADMAYTYAVRTVTKENATSDAGIDLAVAGKVLTLVTCNSFATKSDRFVVTADFVESHPTSS